MLPRRAAAVLAGVALLLHARGAAGVLGEDSKQPGDRNYCVTLESLGISDGQLHPQTFHGDVTDYDLTVDNPATTSVVLTFGLQLSKYDLRHTPHIYVDGERLKYTPLTIISKEIRLDENIGPFDRVVRIVVRDPNPGSWWSHTNSKEYRIHLTQPPEYSKIVRAEQLVVTGKSGVEIDAQPPFNPNSSHVDYYYRVPTNETSVSVEFACPRFTNSLLWDTKPVSMFAPREGWSPAGTVQRIDFSRVLQRYISVACVYRDGSQRIRSRRDYVLTFERNVKISAHLIRPRLLPDIGYCMSRMDYTARLQTNNVAAPPLKQKDEDGYICLTDALRPRIMVESYDPAIEGAMVILRAKDSPYQVRLQVLLPIAISHNRARHSFVMSVKLGTQHIDIPVDFIFASSCISMYCPEHYTQRSSIKTEFKAKKRLCLAEECSVETDRDTCCEKVASCDSMHCQGGELPDSQLDCRAPECTPDDELHCCLEHETCASVDCSPGTALRMDAASVYCEAKVCTKKDRKQCCVKQATCKDFADSFVCPHGKPPPESSWHRHCSTANCHPRDEVHCCGRPASCEEFKCPIGLFLRKGAANLTCFGVNCTEADTHRCCVKIGKAALESLGTLPVSQRKGTVVKVNSDGTYVVNYTDTNEVDPKVPEWAVRDEAEDRLNLRPGDKVVANTAQDGYHIHNYSTGVIEKANEDGTYGVRFFNSDWDAHVPAWAVRAIDGDGNRFVHTGMLSPGQRVCAMRRKRGGYKKVEFAVGTVIAKNVDATFTVQYPSGKTDEHVPVWDLRAINSEGQSSVQPDFEVGAFVEVSDQEQAKEEQFQPRVRDRLRTRYVFGFVEHVNSDGTTYGVKYDLGGREPNVPKWAMRLLSHDTSKRRMFYRVGDRVEARITKGTANALNHRAADVLGVATREKLRLYDELACSPLPGECRPPAHWGRGGPPDTKRHIPRPDGYDVARNPKKRKLCNYDARCREKPELPGCMGGKRNGCRRCGYEGFPPCHEVFDCRTTGGVFGMREPVKNWSAARKEWCCKYFEVGCPWVCRFGKYWPSEAKGWGPWFTPEKRAWCCEHKKISCPMLENPFAVVTTTVSPATTTTHVMTAQPCPDDKGVRGYRFSHAGRWSGGSPINGAASAAECGGRCNATEKCVAFNWREDKRECLVHTELLGRVRDGATDAFLRCAESELVELQGKFLGDGAWPGGDFLGRGGLAEGADVAAPPAPAPRIAFAPAVAALCCLSLLAAWAARRGRRRCRGVGRGATAETAREFAATIRGAPDERGATANASLDALLPVAQGDETMAPLLQ